MDSNTRALDMGTGTSNRALFLSHVCAHTLRESLSLRWQCGRPPGHPRWRAAGTAMRAPHRPPAPRVFLEACLNDLAVWAPHLLQIALRHPLLSVAGNSRTAHRRRRAVISPQTKGLEGAAGSRTATRRPGCHTGGRGRHTQSIFSISSVVFAGSNAASSSSSLSSAPFSFPPASPPPLHIAYASHTSRIAPHTAVVAPAHLLAAILCLLGCGPVRLSPARSPALRGRCGRRRIRRIHHRPGAAAASRGASRACHEAPTPCISPRSPSPSNYTVRDRRGGHAHHRP